MGGEKKLILLLPTLSFGMGAALYITGVSCLGVATEMRIDNGKEQATFKIGVYIAAGSMCMVTTMILMWKTPVVKERKEANEALCSACGGEMKYTNKDGSRGGRERSITNENPMNETRGSHL